MVLFLVVSGGFLASNMGFKIVRHLLSGDGGTESITGTNYIGLPYWPKPGYVNARDLFRDIGMA